MKKSTLLMILSLVLAVALSAGSTLAYLQDTDEDVNVMTLGNVYITQNEQERNAAGELTPFTPNKPVYPAVYEGSSINWADEDKWIVPGDPAWKVLEDNDQVVDKFVTVTNTGSSPAYVRTLIAFEVGEDAVCDPYMHLSCNNASTSDWDYYWLTDDNGDQVTMEIDDGLYAIAVFTYQKVLNPEETTDPSIKQIYLDKTATNEIVEAYGEDFRILALSQAVQTAGFESPVVALDTAFGKVNVDNLETWFANIGDNVGTPGDKWPNNNPPVFAEVTVSSEEELTKAIEEGHTVIGLAAGTYNIPNSAKQKTLTLIGSEGAVIVPANEGENGQDYGFDGANITFYDVTFDTTKTPAGGIYRGFARMTAVYNNCEFIGTYTLGTGTSEFVNCTFDTKDNYIWTWGAKEATFKNCTFDGATSKAILAHGSAVDTVVNVIDCTFKADAVGKTSGGDPVAAVEIDPYGNRTFTINFEGNNSISEYHAGLYRIKNPADDAAYVKVNE